MLNNNLTCREQLLIIVKQITNHKGENEFTIIELLDAMHKSGSIFKESTIRTHITSRCCANVTKYHHQTHYDDYIRISRGIYALNK
ncbi:hypothetical protein AEA09_03825 [Lysinibacillus contaminans]|uniref:DUF7669 domain-containing protein n=1 Tax=Lysinibacillus contaminans TaxID=1293441 RepID=A0ABR5JYQ1_9BACI|nr:hypothetical protein [Lysinibacillus contaminans]KOS67773.1 hypothetical protein AEA09_03825 [Lysinibacillus contaminans]